MPDVAEVKLVKKITMRDMFDWDKKPSKEETKAFFLSMAKNGTGKQVITVAGDVNGYGSKHGEFGETFFLVGNFRARNNITGAIQKAGKCYLPKGDTENVRAAVDKSNGANVSFAMNVSVVEDTASATGYTYIGEPIQTAEVVSREAELERLIASVPMQKRIASPAKAKAA